MVFVSASLWNATFQSESSQHITMLFNNNKCGTFRCTVVYAENLPTNRVSLWKHLAKCCPI